MHMTLIGVACLIIVLVCINEWKKGKRLRDVRNDRKDIADDLEVVTQKQKLNKEKTKLKNEEEKL